MHLSIWEGVFEGGHWSRLFHPRGTSEAPQAAWHLLPDTPGVSFVGLPVVPCNSARAAVGLLQPLYASELATFGYRIRLVLGLETSTLEEFEAWLKDIVKFDGYKNNKQWSWYM